MLNSYVWGRIFSHVQKAKAAVYRWVVVGFSVVCVRGCVWWLQQSCVLNSGSRKARKYCVVGVSVWAKSGECSTHAFCIGTVLHGCRQLVSMLSWAAAAAHHQATAASAD